MKATHIVIHCSATRDTDTLSWGAIRDWHTKHNGWSAIGYHFGVELVNGQYEILAGRMPDRQGAHCREGGMNEMAIGICCVGNFDKEPPPAGQVDLCVELVKYLMRQFNIPAENVIGHREVESNKTCPGLLFDIDLFRELIKEA